mgnify:FL=1
MDVSDEEVDDVLKEIRAYTLASHMYWGIWSVVNSVTALIDFDYWVIIIIININIYKIEFMTTFKHC